MSEPVRILHLESDPHYASLVRETLARDGLTCTIHLARSREEFEQLHDTRWDLVLADWTMSGFDGAQALQVCRSKDPDAPFIFVSATMGEE